MTKAKPTKRPRYQLAEDDALRGPLGRALALEFYGLDDLSRPAIRQDRAEILHESFLMLVEAGTIRVTGTGDHLVAELDPGVAAEIEKSKAEFAASYADPSRAAP